MNNILILLLFGIAALIVYLILSRKSDSDNNNENDKDSDNGENEDKDNGNENDNNNGENDKDNEDKDNGNDKDNNDEDDKDKDNDESIIDKNKKIVMYDLTEENLEVIVPNLKEHEKVYTISFPEDNINVRKVLSDDETDPLHGENYNYLKFMESRFLKKHEDNVAKTRSEVSVLSTVDYKIGDKEVFWIISDRDTDEYFIERDVKLRNKKDGVLIWVAEDTDVDNKKIQFLLDEFLDYRHKIIDYFGKEPVTDDFPILGRRGNVLNIVLASFEPGGYFFSGDLYSFSKSNEGKFLYVNPRFSDNLVAGITAHEYQHLLYYNAKVLAGRSGYDLWINEGFSELAMDISGYGFEQSIRTGAVNSYLRRTKETSLVSWGSRLSDYGSSYLFARYLYDRFGKDIISAISMSNKHPKEAIKDFTGLEFYEVFRDWAITLLAEETGLDVYSKYSFGGNIEIPHLDKLVSSVLEEIDNTDVLGWGIAFTEIDTEGKEDIKIRLNESYLGRNFRKIVIRTEGY